MPEPQQILDQIRELSREFARQSLTVPPEQADLKELSCEDFPWPCNPHRFVQRLQHAADRPHSEVSECDNPLMQAVAATVWHAAQGVADVLPPPVP